MTVIESFTQGKFGDESRNEDKIIVTDHFIAVLDGVTTKLCPKIEGKSGGRFAVDTAEKIIKKFQPDIDAARAVSDLSGNLQKEFSSHIDMSSVAERPSYGLLMYSKARRQIWRVGDLHFMIDGVGFMGRHPVDDITFPARALMIDIALTRGMAVGELLQNDVGRTFIQPALNVQHFLANDAEALHGYGVIDGRSVPKKFMEVFEVPAAKEIVLTSDGYLKLFHSHAESEKYLFDTLKEDPLLYKKHKCSKGLAPDQVSFDDRAYIRFTP